MAEIFAISLWSSQEGSMLRSAMQRRNFRQNLSSCLLTTFQILANNQLDALFHVFIYLISVHVSSITVLIIGRSNYINTSSGMISLCKWLLGMPLRREPPDRHTKQSLTQTNHTRWCINTNRSPDDEHCVARNMYRDEINKYMKKCVKLVISKNL